MALVKTISANGSKGHHRFSLRVSEDTTSGNSSFLSYTFTISPIQSGWDWYGFNIPFSITIGTTTYTGTISSYNGSSTTTLKSGSNIEIAHETDGKKTIPISFSVTDNTGQNYTCGNANASDTMVLTELHKAPTFNTISLTEKTQKILDWGIPTGTIVNRLSTKNCTVNITLEDNATITKLGYYETSYSANVYLYETTYTKSGNNYTFEMPFRSWWHMQPIVENNATYVDITFEAQDSKGGVTQKVFRLPFLPYTIPSVERTNVTIKRKTGNGTTLTDNKGLLNFKGNIYKGNDGIGNNNTYKVQYKLWEYGASEPSSYTNLTSSATINNGVVTITDLEVSNIDYLKQYQYRIELYDTAFEQVYGFGIYDSWGGIIPRGIATWTEYKDRVDFLAITVNQNPIVESGTGYVKYYDGTMVCYGSNTTGTLTWTQDGSRWCSANHTLPNFAQTFISTPIVSKTIQSCNPSGRYICLTGSSSPTTTNPGSYNLDTYWNATNTTVTVSYIAIGKWK